MKGCLCLLVLHAHVFPQCLQWCNNPVIASPVSHTSIKKKAHWTKLLRYTDQHTNPHTNFVALHKHHVSYSRTSDSISSSLLLHTKWSWSKLLLNRAQPGTRIPHKQPCSLPETPQWPSCFSVRMSVCVLALAVGFSVLMCSSPASSFPLCAALLQPDH